MYVYIVIDFLLLLLYIKDNGRNSKKAFVVSAIILFLLVSLHDGQFTNDYQQYLNFFLGKNSMYGTINFTNNIENGYILFIRFLHFFVSSSLGYIFSISLLICIPFLYLVNKLSNNRILSILLLVTINDGLTLQTFFCAHRQMLAVSMLFCVIIVARKRICCWKLIGLVLVICAVLTHSTSYFVLFFLVLLYFIPFNNKKIYYILLGVSLVLGTFINLSDLFLNFISFFSIIDGAMRSVNHVLNSDHYSLGIWSFLPLTILGFSFVYYTSSYETNNFYLKSFVIGVVCKNLFGFFPLINRSIFFLILLGLIGAIPSSLKYNYSQRYIYALLVVLYIYFLSRMLQNPPENFMLPYNFIFD